MGDHQSNGHIESAVRQLKSQMRALRLALEKRIGKALSEEDPILTWIPTFAGDVIARYRRGSDGKTPWQRETGRKWAGEPLEFGERLFIKEAKERGTAAKKDWEARLLEARFVGQHARTGAIMGLTSEGIIYGRLGRRVPEEERWTLEGWENLKGVPWNLNPTGREQPRVVLEAQPGGGEGRNPVARIAEAAVSPRRQEDPRRQQGERQEDRYEPLHREFYVTKADIERMGPTEGCKACDHIRQKKTSRCRYTHTEVCRERVTERLVEENSTRVEAYLQRHAEKERARPKRRLEEEEGVHEEQPSSPKFPKEMPAKLAEKRSAEVSAEELKDATQEEVERKDYEEEREERERMSIPGHKERQDRLEREAVSPARRKEEANEGQAGSTARTREERGDKRGESEAREDQAQGSTVGSAASSQGGAAGSSAPILEESRSGISAPADRTASHASNPARDQEGLIIPMEVAEDSRKDMEDVIATINYNIDNRSEANTFGDSILGSDKDEMIDLATIQIEQFRRRMDDQEMDDNQVEELAALLLEIGSAQVVEIFSPKRFVRKAAALGLRPGFAVDLCEPKPYGKNEGEYWDLMKESDVQELEVMIDYEQPWFVTGSPPCTAFSALQNINVHKRNSQVVEKEKSDATKLLEVAIKFYNKQVDENRYFLHEHPLGCDSWDHPSMIELQRRPGIFTVTSPMCCWQAQLPGRGGEGFIYKPTKWVTNSVKLAQALDQVCANKRAGKMIHRHTTLIGGIAYQAASYSPKLVKVVLRAMRDEALQQGWLSSVDARYGGPDPTQTQFDTENLDDAVEKMEHYDSITGEQLPHHLIAQGKKEEIEWTRSIKLYTKVPRSQALASGAKVIPVKWVLVNKGDPDNPKVRCRLVAKELKAKTKEAILAHELFAAMPPWECIKALFALMVCDKMDKDDELEVAVFDISRAHFMAEMDRELYVEIVEEDKEEGEGDKVGRLNRSMYGCRTASANWMRDWQQLLSSVGCVVGVANPALFYNAEKKVRGAVHGDDFVVLGPPSSLKMIGKTLATKYSVREAHRLGFGDGCERSAIILNRVVALQLDEQGRKEVIIEPDFRHIQLVLRDLGLDKENAKGLTTPTIKIDDAEIERRKHEQALAREMTTMFRSCVMRLSFVSQDRADLAEPVKTLSRQMSRPTQGSLQDLKRIGRYLRHRPSMGLIFRQQPLPESLDVFVDSDFAACRRTRRSTTGMVVRLGTSTLKASSNMQGSVGLNVSECEYYALVHGAAHGLGLQAYLKDLGLNFNLRIFSDSSSAKALSNRRGLGKQRHVQTRYLWLQERVALRHLEVRKVGTKDNISDILTKSCNRETLERHVETIGLRELQPHILHKEAVGSIAGSIASIEGGQVRAAKSIAGRHASNQAAQARLDEDHPSPRRGREVSTLPLETVHGKHRCSARKCA